MRRLYWGAAAACLLALDVYLVGWRLAEVQGNLEAAAVWATPAFVVSHVLRGRRSGREHAERLAADERRHRERLDADAELHRKVGELHDLSIEGRLPARILKP